LGDVKREDLKSITRLLTLYGDAVGWGLARCGEAGRLEFVAAAVHAVRTATKNPCGLFATIVRKGLWDFVTQSDEDYARARLAGFFEGKRRNPGSARSPAADAKPLPISMLLSQIIK
jgi:hypothetical protein